MTSFLRQPMRALKAGKAIFFAAIAVAPFLMVDMGYDGRVLKLFGTFPGVIFYMIGYLACLNIVDQILTAIFLHSYQNMPLEMRRRWKIVMIVLSVVAVASIGELIFIYRSSSPK